MKVNSNNHPGDFTKSKSKIYFNYNIIQSERTDEFEDKVDDLNCATQIMFDYDEEEVNENKDSSVYKLMINKFKSDSAVIEVVEVNKIEYDKRMKIEHQEFKPYSLSDFIIDVATKK